jgi:hypothetical protein
MNLKAANAGGSRRVIIIATAVAAVAGSYSPAYTLSHHPAPSSPQYLIRSGGQLHAGFGSFLRRPHR